MIFANYQLSQSESRDREAHLILTAKLQPCPYTDHDIEQLSRASHYLQQSAL